MSLIDKLDDQNVWESFYSYKLSLACPKAFTARLRGFIDEKRYLPVCRRIKAGERFPLSRRSVISKMGSEKKRVVYTYPEDENTVLKLLTWLTLRRYDGVFTPGLWSFRPGRTAKDAVRALLRTDGIFGMFAYKADVRDYFNSIPVKLLIPKLETVLADDPVLCDFIVSLVAEPRVIDGGKIILETKGIMAGTPLSAFLADLFLSDLDRYFSDRGVIYARYSDDIIVFAPDGELREKYAASIAGFLRDNSLFINASKEERFDPGDGFTFLGFYCRDGQVDIAPSTLKKLKAKMRRKRDALARWAKREEADPRRAAGAFVRVFNRKLLESPSDHELSWSAWFFPVINTANSLHEIDLYAQDCLRYLLTGKHTKARYNASYSDLKSLGYRSLVREFYCSDVK